MALSTAISFKYGTSEAGTSHTLIQFDKKDKDVLVKLR